MSPTVSLALKALVVGAGVGLLAKAFRKPTEKAPPNCSGLSNSGGTLNGIRYLETIRGGTDPNVAMPMVVVFHSRGATPEGAASFQGISGPVRVIRPAGFHRTQEGGYTWFTKSSKTDPEGLTLEMRQRAVELAGFLGALMACRPTTGLPIVTGSSEGGHVSYLMASQQPGIVGGAVALLGYIPPGIWNFQMAPTVGLHATADSTVPYERTLVFWDAMKSAGAPLSTQIFPGGHSVSDAMSAAWRSAVSKFVAEQKSAVA